MAKHLSHAIGVMYVGVQIIGEEDHTGSTQITKHRAVWG